MSLIQSFRGKTGEREREEQEEEERGQEQFSLFSLDAKGGSGDETTACFSPPDHSYRNHRKRNREID